MRRFFLSVIFAGGIFSLSLHAATVSTLADSGPGSLRQALINAMPGETIDFSVTGTINLNSRLLVDQPVTITGPGMNQLSINGQNNHRVMEITANPVIIEDLAIINGMARGGDGGDSETGGGGGGGGAEGGGVFAPAGSDVSFNRVRFAGNTAQGGDGGSSGVTGLGSTGGTGGTAAGGLGSPGGNGGNSGGNAADILSIAGGGGGGGMGAGTGGGSTGSLRAQPGGEGIATLGGGGGGGVGLGGAIFSDGTVTVERCVFESNAALPGKRGINNFRTLGVQIDGGALVTPDDSRRGSAIFVSSGNLTVIDEIQFGLNSRVNPSGLTPEFPTNPAAFIQAPAEIQPAVAITRSPGPAAQTFPQIDNSGHPRLPFIFRNINDVNVSDTDPMMPDNNTTHFGVTVTQILSALAGFQLVDSDTTLNAMGIAITGIDTSNGIWDYRLPAGPIEYAMIEGVSETSALLLPPDALVRFTAFPEYISETGPEPFIEFRAWDDAGNMALIDTFADTSTNGAGTSFSAEIGRVHQPVDVALKWFAQYMELPDGSQLVPEVVDLKNPPPFPRALARFTRYEVKTAGNPNQASTLVGVGGTYAAGPSVTSEHSDYFFASTNGPGEVATGVLQMASVGTRTFDGFGSQSIFSSPVILHGPLRLTAVNDTATTEEDQAVLIDVLLNDNDPTSADPLILISALVSERGVSPTVTGSQIRYTPRGDFHGRDSFFYLVSSTDGQRFAVGQVEVTITSVNDAPSFTLDINTVTVDEDAGPQNQVVVSNVSAGTDLQRDIIGNLRTFDSAGTLTEGRPESVDQVLTFEFTPVSIDPTLVFSAGPIIDPATGELSFTAAPDSFGVATFDILLRDSGPSGGNNVNSTATQTFTITVNPINDAPAVSALYPFSVLEDSSTALSGLSITDIDVMNGDLSMMLNVDQGILSATVRGGVTISGSGTSNLTLTGTQTALNALLGSNQVIFQTGLNQAVDSTLTITADDMGNTGAGGPQSSVPLMAIIDVIPVNDPPTFVVTAPPGVLEDAGPQVVPGVLSMLDDGDADAMQALSIMVSTDNPGLFSMQPAIDAAGELSYTAAADANGSATVTVTVMDDGGTANGGVNMTVDSFVITVSPVNDVPTFALGANPVVLEDAGPQAINGFATGISAGPANESGQMLSFVVTGNDNSGLFSAQPAINAANGQLTFTPATDANGSANITVILMDDGGTADGGVDTSAVQAFTIDVTAVNDVPEFSAGPDEASFNDDGPQTIDPWATGLSAGPADESGQTLNFNVVSNSNPGLFAAGPSISSTGVLTYTSTPDADGSADIGIVLMDNGGTANGGVDTSAVQSFNISITPSSADLMLTISNTAVPPVMPGSGYSYVLDLLNGGPGRALDTLVTIDFPNNLILTDTGGCITENADGTLSWSIGALPAGEMVQCTFDVKIVLSGAITLVASATADLDDPNPADNTDISDVVTAEPLVVPTLSNWALLLMAGLLVLIGWRRSAFR